MISPTDLRALAQEMKSAQDAARQIEPFTGRIPGFDLPAAYEVSRLIHEARVAEGARLVGRKIGFSNPGMWPIYGVDEPVWAHLYDRTVVMLEGTSDTFPLAGLMEPKIEPEIVLHFRAPPPPGGSLRQVAECVDWVAHAFEIVQSHFPGWKFRAPDVVADDTLRGFLLVGPPRPLQAIAVDPIAALESFTLDLDRNGALVESGRGANVLGSPLAATAHLVSVISKQPGFAPLGAGEMVTTGTITTAHAIRPGETWRSRLQGIALPGLEVTFLP